MSLRYYSVNRFGTEVFRVGVGAHVVFDREPIDKVVEKMKSEGITGRTKVKEKLNDIFFSAIKDYLHE